MDHKYTNDSIEEKKVEHKKKNKKLHLRYRWIFIAMLIALLFLLNWDGLNFGGGKGTTENGAADGVDSDTNSIVSTEKDEMNSGYTISIQGELIYSGYNKKLEEITMEELKIELSELEPQIVTIRDEGAVNRIYNQVVELVDSFHLDKVETTK